MVEAARRFYGYPSGPPRVQSEYISPGLPRRLKALIEIRPFAPDAPNSITSVGHGQGAQLIVAEPEEVDTDPIDPLDKVDIDDEYYLWYGAIENRLNKKHIMPDIHFKIKVTGDPTKVELFHGLIKAVDNDYPQDPFRKRGTKVKFCKKCHGMFWPRNIVEPNMLKRAAKQCGVKVKIKHFIKDFSCGREYVEQEI